MTPLDQLAQWISASGFEPEGREFDPPIGLNHKVLFFTVAAKGRYVRLGFGFACVEAVVFNLSGRRTLRFILF